MYLNRGQDAKFFKLIQVAGSRDSPSDSCVDEMANLAIRVFKYEVDKFSRVARFHLGAREMRGIIDHLVQLDN